MIRVVMADDHELIRLGLKKVLVAEPDITLAGEASTLPATLDLLALGDIDVLVLDLSLEHGSEIQTLLTVRKAFPAVPVLVLSVHAEEHMAIPALKAGAAGYVSKTMAAEQVVEAIRKIGNGGRYISPRVAELLAEELSTPAMRLAHQYLTRREHEVFQLLGQGMAIKHVAAQLKLSISSVNTYRTRIFRKTGLRNNAALIRYAVQHRLTD